MMKKILTYFSLFILICSFIATPLAAYSETIDNSDASQTKLKDNSTEDRETIANNKDNTEQSGAQKVAPQSIETTTPKESQIDSSKESQSNSTITQQVSQDNPSTTSNSTGSYIAQISDANTDKPAYYGSDIINLYNGISVSGSAASVVDGSYSVISLPKDSFDKPTASGVSTSFDTFKSLEIKETETDWQIITTYKTLVGGYSADTPFKVNLISRKVINQTQHIIKQEFYSVNNELLANNSYPITAKAVIESPYSYNSNPERITKEIDDKYIVKDGQVFTFGGNNLGYPQFNRSDPRDRRVIVTIPDNSKIKDGTGWTKVSGTSNQYFKDVTRDKFDSNNIPVQLDLSGLDLSSNDSSSKSNRLTVSYSVQPVVNGVTQTDLPENKWSITRSLYVLKQEPETPTSPVSANLYTYNYFSFIDDNYQVIPTSPNRLYIPVESKNVSSKGRQTQQIVYNHVVSSKKNQQDPVKFVIKTSQMTVSKYIDPTQLKVNFIGLSDENVVKMTNKLKGTKVYGIKSDGTMTLLSDDIMAQNASTIQQSFNKEGWLTFASGDYSAIKFEYPNDGLEFDKTEYDAGLYKTLYTSIIGNVKSKISDDLKSQLPNAPLIQVNDFASTTVETSVHSNDKDDTIIKIGSSHTSAYPEYYLLQYDLIQRRVGINVTNGSAFYTNDTISVNLDYLHTRNGNALNGITPKNLNIYYLVPDGLTPVEDTANFSSIQTIPSYTPGYNLIIAKPIKINVPNNLNVITETVTNGYSLSFKVNSRLPIGKYNIKASIAIDNNKFNVDSGGSSGIIQYDTPYGDWSNITTNADNRSDNSKRFTDMSSTPFNLYPNKILVAYKSVKLASEPDVNYGSSLGTKGKIGSAINYQLKLVNNSTRDIDSVSLIDKLPSKGDKTIAPNANGEYANRGSLFTTPLTGPVTSDIFDIYYAIDAPKESIDDTKNMNWLSSVSDYSKVTAIKAVLKEGRVIKVNESVSIILTSQIENSPSIHDGDKAFNSFAYSLNDGKAFIEALSTEVPVNYDKKDMILNKFDKNNPEIKLAGAFFDLYEKEGDRKVAENVETSTSGQATLKNLIIGKSYYLKEVVAPTGYNKLETPIEFTVKDDQSTIDVANVKDENITISGTKFWRDMNNLDGSRPDQVTIHLLSNGNLIDSKQVTKDSNWQYQFSDVPKYQDGKEIVYTVTEDTVKDYSTEISGFDVINTHTPGYTSATVTKNWMDDNNRDQIRPESVKVQLLANGEKYGEKIELNASNNWTNTWHDLPVKINEKDIKYTIEEDPVEGYKLAVNDDNIGNILLTNTHDIAKLSIKGTKTWDDLNNQADKRPDHIIVNLLANGNKIAQQIVKADNNGAWLYEFKDVPKFDSGKIITYTVTEDSIDNYTTVINGFNITNIYISKQADENLPSTNDTNNSWFVLAGIFIVASLGWYIYKKIYRE